MPLTGRVLEYYAAAHTLIRSQKILVEEVIEDVFVIRPQKLPFAGANSSLVIT